MTVRIIKICDDDCHPPTVMKNQLFNSPTPQREANKAMMGKSEKSIIYSRLLEDYSRALLTMENQQNP